ncbi:MAG: tetratricopeptide repeat protein, partial [Pedosphaera sp.]|nr:tetratricopeptide repeat protein [Pedosphaera sp.]
EPEVAATVAPAKQQKPAVRALPAGAAPLVAEAQRAFGAGQFDAAEQKYLEVLKMDEKNTIVLANLAAINLQQNHLPQAEERLTAALSIEPADAHLQSLMGILRFRQDKVDEALDYLSKASVTDPKDSETQNYLGIALSQKGQRGPAENAFRRAIQINPNYAGAHYNLSMAYTTSQPPALELARFHYQKAVKLGYPANPAVEKMIDGN